VAFPRVPVTPSRPLRRARVAAAGVVALVIVAVGLVVAGRGTDRGPAPMPLASVAAVVPALTPGVSPGATPAATAPWARPTPRSRQLVIPAVPCNKQLPAEPLPVALIVDGGATVTGSPGDAVPVPEVRLPPGGRALMILGAENCALAWTVRATRVGAGVVTVVADQANPREDLSYGSQNRWDVAGLPPGDYVLVADFGLSRGRAVHASWRLHVAGMSPAPTAS
jgi:hypothetical protein